MAIPDVVGYLAVVHLGVYFTDQFSCEVLFGSEVPESFAQSDRHESLALAPNLTPFRLEEAAMRAAARIPL